MKLHPRVSRSGLELVKRFEGLRRHAARLPDGGWTLGYGHTRSAREGSVVSPEDAEALLYYDLSEVAEKVEAWTFTPLNQNQFEALIAFAFNIGVDNFRHSTVLKRVNEGQHLMAAAALELWRKSNFDGEDIVIDALVRRRAAEKAHFLTPPEGHRPSPTPVLKPAFDHSVIEAAAAARAGRPAAVVDAPLHGDRARATIEGGAEAPDAWRTVNPVKALAETTMTTAPPHQLYPDRGASAPANAWSPNTFGLVGDEEPDSADAAPLKDAPFGDYAASSRALETPTDVPKPVEIVPQPAPGLEASAQPPGAVEPVRSIFLVGGTEAPHRLDEPPSAHEDSADKAGVSAPNPSPGRPMIGIFAGVLGVLLVAAAVFSMFSGKADFVNLAVGLTGILLMIAAGGYLLVRRLKKNDDPIEA
jgi:lysozyme